MNDPAAMNGTDQAATAPDAGQGKKTFTVTVNDDGSFIFSGDNGDTPIADLKGLIDAITQQVGGDTSSDQSGEGSPEDNASATDQGAAADDGSITAEGSPEDLKAKYAKKKGMRPSVKPDFSDYFSRPPQ